MSLPAFTAAKTLRPTLITDSGAPNTGDAGLSPAETFYAIAELFDAAGQLIARGCGKGSTLQKAAGRAREHAGNGGQANPMHAVRGASKAEYNQCRAQTKLGDTRNTFNQLGF